MLAENIFLLNCMSGLEGCKVLKPNFHEKAKKFTIQGHSKTLSLAKIYIS